MNERHQIHDANAATLNAFGGWHAWCTCPWRKNRLADRSAAEIAVYEHLLEFDPERARRYALEKGLQVPTTMSGPDAHVEPSPVEVL